MVAWFSRFSRFSRHASAIVLMSGVILSHVTQPPPCSAQTPDLIVTTDNNDRVLRFDGVTGVFLSSLRDGSHSGNVGISSCAIGGDGRLHVTISYAAMIARLSLATNKFEIFTEGGHLSIPHQIAFGPDGDLYVANYGDRRVDRFDGVTGKFKFTVFDQFGGEVTGLAVDKFGNVYISERHGAVFKYDGNSIPAIVDGVNPEALLIGPDGLLYVVSRGIGGVLRYKLDGTPYGANGNTSDPTLAVGGGLIDPVGIAIGPSGNIFVTDYNTNAVFAYNRVTGAPLGVFTQPGPEIIGAWGICFYLPPGALKPLTLPLTATGGQVTTGTVNLDQPAPAGGAMVWLSTNSSAATVPVSVVVPVGKKKVDFSITTSVVASNTSVAITATYVGLKTTGSITLTP